MGAAILRTRAAYPRAGSQAMTPVSKSLPTSDACPFKPSQVYCPLAQIERLEAAACAVATCGPAEGAARLLARIHDMRDDGPLCDGVVCAYAGATALESDRAGPADPDPGTGARDHPSPGGGEERPLFASRRAWLLSSSSRRGDRH